jgi:hypothetical protein
MYKKRAEDGHQAEEELRMSTRGAHNVNARGWGSRKEEPGMLKGELAVLKNGLRMSKEADQELWMSTRGADNVNERGCGCRKPQQGLQ